MKIKTLPLILTLALAGLSLHSCTEDTGTIGVIGSDEIITTSSEYFDIATRSILMDDVQATSINSYLGSVIDPETNTAVLASFAAQFHIIEDYHFPALDKMILKDDGFYCDSIDLRLYYDTWFGAGDNPMKLSVYPLSADKIFQEDTTYYTDMDFRAEGYVTATQPIATRTFTALDYATSTKPQQDIANPNIRVRLPREVGEHIIRTYYQHPEYYINSRPFIRHVLPGYYFTIGTGMGTMLQVYATALNMYFDCHTKTRDGRDTVSVATFVAGATPEVIQTTGFRQDALQALADIDTCTYIKTPAGICTQVTIPIDDIYAGAHANDSVSRLNFTLMRINKAQDTDQLGTPATLLLVPKAQYTTFFQKHKMPDGRTTHYANFNTSRNAYTFSNLASLVSSLHYSKLQVMHDEGLTSQQYNEKYPDWNQLLLVPVKVSVNETTGVVASITHDLGMGSCRLVGGPANPIRVQVYYTNFSKNE